MTFFYMITFTIWFLWTLLDSLRSLYLIRFCGIRRSLSVQTASCDVKLGMFKWRTVACWCVCSSIQELHAASEPISKQSFTSGRSKETKKAKEGWWRTRQLFMTPCCMSFFFRVHYIEIFNSHVLLSPGHKHSK